MNLTRRLQIAFNALECSWEKNTSQYPVRLEEWSIENPAIGQSLVSSLVLLDQFPGILIKGRLAVEKKSKEDALTRSIRLQTVTSAEITPAKFDEVDHYWVYLEDKGGIDPTLRAYQRSKVVDCKVVERNDAGLPKDTPQKYKRLKTSFDIMTELMHKYPEELEEEGEFYDDQAREYAARRAN